jgi:hypothetical protein
VTTVGHNWSCEATSMERDDRGMMRRTSGGANIEAGPINDHEYTSKIAQRGDAIGLGGHKSEGVAAYPSPEVTAGYASFPSDGSTISAAEHDSITEPSEGGPESLLVLGSANNSSPLGAGGHVESPGQPHAGTGDVAEGAEDRLGDEGPCSSCFGECAQQVV